MNLEQQVCSLDLAKRLKELGVRQHSAFAWWANHQSSHWKVWGSGSSTEDWFGELHIAAFTVAELYELLRPYKTGDLVIPFKTEAGELADQLAEDLIRMYVVNQ